MLFYTRLLASLLSFSVKTIALGINCRGSGLCPRASFLNSNDASVIQILRDVVHATSLPDTTVYNSGDHIVCVSQSTKITISPTFEGQIGDFSAGASIGLSGSINSGGICLFPQGASLTLGSIKPLTDAILDHKCTTCGSVPIHFVDQGSNDPGAGILTFNYVAAPTCDRNCIRSLGSPDSGKSPSSQPAQQPSSTPLQQPPTQASVTPVNTRPIVTEPITVIQQPFTSPSEPEPITITQTPTSVPSEISSSSVGGSGGGGGVASGSDDDTGSSAGSGGGAAATLAVDSVTQQVVTVMSTQAGDQQGSVASATQGGDEGAGAAAGPSTVTVAPGSSTVAAGVGVVTVTGGSASTPSGNAGASGQGAIGSASPSSGLGVPGSARMAGAAWLCMVIPLTALL